MSYSAALSDTDAAPYNGLSPIDDLSTGAGSVPQVSSTVDQEHQATAADVASGHELLDKHRLTMAFFEKQPPDNMRKSNFFNFVVSLYDSNQQLVEVQRATFKDFYDTYSTGQEYRNGLIYQLSVVYGDGTQKEEELYVRLIDSQTKQLIPYEGSCKNPDFRRVLLTHELICSRCLEHRSCGNKNDTPSDPIIIDRFHLKFFVKCNQNCLKNAGNPKDSRRRFQVALFSAEGVSSASTPIASSESMFVHNNSKHGRRQPAPYAGGNPPIVGDGKPYIIAVYPPEGWVTGGNKVCIVGMNFYDGIEVVFGTLPATSEVLSPNAIAVKVPQSPRSGEVDITLVFKGSQFCITNPGKFVYLTPDDNIFDHNFTRLERLLRNHDDPEDIPKDILLRRSADVLEAFYALPKVQHTPSGPINHINPLYYPRSPALFALAPQSFNPRFNSAGAFSFVGQGPPRMTGTTHFHHAAMLEHGSYDHPSVMQVKVQSDEGSFSHSNPVSRCSSSETIPQSQQHQPQATMETGMNGSPNHFHFPSLPHNDSMPPPGAEIGKSEPMPPPSVGLHKPKPMTQGIAAVPMYHPGMVPYVPIMASGSTVEHSSFGMGSLSGLDPSIGYVVSSDGSLEHSNRNNNNSTHTQEGMMANLAANPIQFIPKIVPSSPGYIMAPTASPGPLPATPTGSSGPIFNFCSPPLMSPAKPLKGSKPAPLSLQDGGSVAQNFSMMNYPQAVLAAMPSPSYGTFLFPPVTPTGLLAPISLPELSVTTDAHTTATVSTSRHLTTTSSGPTAAPPPPKKPKLAEVDTPTTSH